MDYEIINCSRFTQPMFLVEIVGAKGEVLETSETFHTKQDAEKWGVNYLEKYGDIDFSEEP
jgi:hypothetical protein